MSRFTALFINAIVIVGLLTQTLTSSVAVITHASELAQVVAPISALNSPLAPPAPGIVPEVGLQKPRVRLQVDFESKNARDAQKVNGVVRAVRIDKNGIASTPFTVALDLPLGLDYLPGSSTGQYDEAHRRLTWPDVTLDPGAQIMLPFQAIVNVQAPGAPTRLSMRPSAQGDDAATRFLSRPTQLQVLRAMPGQRITVMDGGAVRTSNGRVQLAFDPYTIKTDSVVITADEYAAMPPSALMPDAPSLEWKTLAKTAYQDSFGSDPEQSLDNDIQRLSLVDPLLKVDFYPSMVFSRPVTATFDLSGQVAAELAASGLAPILQSVIEEPDRRAHV